MIKQTIGVGLAMIALGVVAYLVTGMVSVTALIPSFFGVVIVGLGVGASKAGEGGRRGLLIGAMVVGVLGLLGPLGRLVQAAARGELALGSATIAQVVFIVLAGYLVVALGLGLFKKK